jgi:hypothetical protein
VPDLHQTLAQLDHRLEDLRRQVARLTQDAGQAASWPSAANPGVATAPRPAPASPGEPAPAPPAPRGDVPDVSLARLDADVAPPRALDGGQEAQVHELLAACERLLGEARELLGTAGAVPARPAFFEGTVALAVLGAHRMQTIQVLEDSLIRARHVMRAYIRRTMAGEVRFELTLIGGVELIGELNRVMPFPFAVRSATPGEIVVSLEGEGVDL